MVRDKQASFVSNSGGHMVSSSSSISTKRCLPKAKVEPMAIASLALNSVSSEIYGEPPVIGSIRSLAKEAQATSTSVFNKNLEEEEAIVAAYIDLAVVELKKNGSFEVLGLFNLKLMEKPARPAQRFVHPYAKAPCVIKAKPASKTVKCSAMKKLKEAIYKGME